jgi:hypothetical protein
MKTYEANKRHQLSPRKIELFSITPVKLGSCLNLGTLLFLLQCDVKLAIDKSFQVKEIFLAKFPEIPRIAHDAGLLSPDAGATTEFLLHFIQQQT